jgi:hypothetical protein
VELDIELVHADGHDVVVALGASGAAADALDFGDAWSRRADLADLVGLLQRGAGTLASEMVALPSLKAGRNSLPIIG